MQESIIRFSLDVREMVSPIVVKAKQDDTGRVLLIRLSDGGADYPIAEGCYAVFTGRKPDGNLIHNPCSIENGEILYRFTQQTCACPGTMLAEIKLYGADTGLITSGSFLIDVYESVYREGDAVSSEGEMTTLDALIQETTELKQEVSQALKELENGGYTPGTGGSGEDGGYYLPQISQPDIHTMTVSFFPSKEGMEIPLPKEIVLPAGREGAQGRGIVSIQRTSGNGAAGTTDVYTISYTDETTSTFRIYNGANGKDGTGGSGGTGADGEDGATFVPYVDAAGNLSWSNNKGIANPDTVNIRGPKGDTGEKGDKGEKGDTGAPGADGAKGEKGDKGDKGDTGAAGTNGANGVSATHVWNGTRLSVTSASGTSSADLKGEKGDKGDTGIQGPKGDTGADGAQGPKGDTGETGAAGYSPVRGTDYWTASDIAEIKSYVNDAILGGAW